MAANRTIRELRESEFDFQLVPKDNLLFVSGQLQEAGAQLDKSADDEANILAAWSGHDAAVEPLNAAIGQAATFAGAATEDTTSAAVKEMAGSKAHRDYLAADFAYTLGLANQNLNFLTDNPPPVTVAPEPVPPDTEPPPGGGLPSTPPEPEPPDPIGKRGDREPRERSRGE